MIWLAIVAGLLFFAVAVVFTGRFGTDPTISSSPLIGKAVPNSVLALMDEPGSVEINDFDGDILVVNYWASWCLGCRIEHSALIQASDEYADFGVTFIAINYQDTPQGADAFLEELGRSEATVYTVDDDSRVAFDWGVLGLPETFFVDRDGIVVGKISGPLNYGLLTRTIDQIILGEVIGEISTGEVENR